MVRVLLACSGGGHLREGLALIRELYDLSKDSIGIFTYFTKGAEQLLPEAKWFFTVNPGRNPLKYIRVFVDSARTLSRFSPEIVISTGAGMTLPILLLAKARGIRTVFYESAAQVVSPSVSARIAHIFVDELYYPWPQLERFFGRGRQYKPPILQPPASLSAEKKNLVLVIVGTHPKPFDRLLQLVDNIAPLFPDRAFVFQIGHSNYTPRHGKWFRFTDAKTIERLFTEARWVVAHAGVGTIMDALSHGVVPFVIPRLKKYGEHTNDHQVQIVKQLSKLGTIRTGSKEDLVAYLKTLPRGGST